MAGHLLITNKYVGETDSETKAIRQIVKDVTKTVGVAIAGYVVIDTLRQVIVVKASQP